MSEKLPFSGGNGFGVNGANDALAAKLICRFGHHIGIGHSGGVKAYFIGACQ